MIEIDNEKVPLRKNRAFSDFIDGITLTVVAVLLVVIFMVYMTQVSFNSSVSWKDVGFEGVLMYACTVSIYLLLRAFSRRKGKQSEKYNLARERIERNNARIVSEGFARRTAEYCRAWEDQELDTARSHVLSDAGIKLGEFNGEFCKYGKKEIRTKFPDLSEFQIQTIFRAKKIKRLKYDESYLSVYDRNGRRISPSGGIKTKTVVRLQTVQTLFTTALTSVFSVSMALDIIADPSFATVVTCLVKIVIILGFGAWGMVGGYNMSAVRETDELGAKADEQERFMKWCETTPDKKKTPASE